MNKLYNITALKKDWCSEIIWGQTDKYVVKTIELLPNSVSPIFLHTRRDKHFILVAGELYFVYGECCNDEPLKTYKLPVGWSWYIEPKKLYQYKTFEKNARLIEVSSYEKDIDELVFDEDDLNSGAPAKRLGIDNPIKKKGRPKGSKNKGNKQ